MTITFSTFLLLLLPEQMLLFVELKTSDFVNAYDTLLYFMHFKKCDSIRC